MLNSSNIKLVIFDCDGVLIDSEILSQRVLLALLAQKQVHVDEQYFRQYFLGRTFECVTKQVLDDFSVHLDEDFRSLFRETLFTSFNQELEKTQGLDEVLAHLDVPSCVATSSSPARVSHALSVVKLNKYFENRVFSAALVEHGKPNPDIFLYAAEKMGVAPHSCLVIEDSASGIQAGLSAGMQVVQFNGATHMQYLQDKALFNGVPAMQSWQEIQEHFSDLFNVNGNT